MYANVFERRREIGTLIRRWGPIPPAGLEGVSVKALLLGAARVELAATILGSIFAFVLVRSWLACGCGPMWELAIAAIVISIGLTLAASYFPARRAARLDPCATFQRGLIYVNDGKRQQDLYPSRAADKSPRLCKPPYLRGRFRFGGRPQRQWQSTLLLMFGRDALTQPRTCIASIQLSFTI